MLLTETVLVLASLLVAFVHPSLGGRWFEKVERRLFQLSRHRVLSIIVVGLVALGLRAALLPVEPIPQPTVHDDFSYLLMADTFAHGRLANPTHPMWIHFEPIYVNQKPTYVSKYFPAQGLVLALGQMLFGHPFWGVWLGIGVMCAAICWMLQAWSSPFWALLGSLLAAVRLGTFSDWSNSYTGAALPAIGGALVLGALPRIRRGRRVLDSILMGLGFVLLASSRPLEGLLLSLPVAAVIARWIWNARNSGTPDRLTRSLVPMAMVLALGLAALFYYFWRTTGSPFHTPYQVNLQTQDPVPLFPWQPLRPIPQYHHEEVRRFYTGWEIDQYTLVRSHYVISSITRVLRFYLFFFAPALTIPFLLLAAGSRRSFFRRSGPSFRFLVIVVVISTVALLLPTYYGPNYAAALTCVVYSFLVNMMRCVRRWTWKGNDTGLAIVRTVHVICLLMLLLRTMAPLPGVPVAAVAPATWCSPHPLAESSRTAVQTALESKPGLQLALVRYSQHSLEGVDWVQNLANIDNQKVVWARDMGAQNNEELIRYYKGRHVWLVEPEKTSQFSPYPTF